MKEQKKWVTHVFMHIEHTNYLKFQFSDIIEVH